MRLLFAALSCLLFLLGCEREAPSPPAPPPVEVFSCSHLLIGLETVYCREDVIGPGKLTISFRPDPKETSWEIGIRGLAALAEQCEFQGQFDQTRLSALQGRGQADIACEIAAHVDRQYHEFRLENLLDAPNTAIQVVVAFQR